MQWTWTIANLEAAVVFLSSYSAGAVVSPSLSLFVCVGSIRPDDLSRNATHKWGISILASLPPFSSTRSSYTSRYCAAARYTTCV